MRAVLKIGGSLLYDKDGNILVEKVRNYAAAIKSLVKVLEYSFLLLEI